MNRFPSVLRRSSAVVLLLIAIYFLLGYGIYTTLTQRVLGANDFYSRWAGARALLLDGMNPYSDTVTREIQMGMYGRLAHPDEDQVAYAYPLYTAFVVAPLVGLPYAQAQALWMALLIVGVVGGTVLLARRYGLSLKPFVLGTLLLALLLYYPTVRGVFLGQFTLFVFFCIALAIVAIAKEQDMEAGILLALATVKPQPALFLVPVLVLWAARHRRWRVLWSAAVTVALLVGLAFVYQPTWLFDFAAGLGKYAAYEPVGPPVQTLVESILPGAAATRVYFALSALLVVWMAWRVWRTLDATWMGFQPTLGFVAIVTTLMAGRVGTPDQMLLLIPWLYWIARWLRRGQWLWAVLGTAMLIVLPWTVFVLSLRGDSEHVGVTLVLPFVTLFMYIIQTMGIPVRRPFNSLAESSQRPEQATLPRG